MKLQGVDEEEDAPGASPLVKGCLCCGLAAKLSPRHDA